MPLTTLIETGHQIYLANSVPKNALNLAYLEYPALTPERYLTIFHTAYSIPGNIDDAVLNTRQICVVGIQETPTQRWTLLLRPGSFYQQETITASSPARPSWLVTAWTGPAPTVGDSYYWEYSLAIGQTTQATAGISDAIREVGSDTSRYEAEIPLQLADGSLRVSQAPLDPTVTPTMRRYINDVVVPWRDGSGMLYSDIPLVIVDALHGILQTPCKLTGEETLQVSYTGTGVTYEFSGYFTSTGTYYPLDFNPTAGHFLLHPDNQDLDPVTRSTAFMHGVGIYLEPVRVSFCPQDGETVVYTSTTHPDIFPRLSWRLGTTPVADDATTRRVELACVFVKSPLTANQIVVHDTRQRGGGVSTDSDLSLLDDMARYFDLTNFDGEPSMENGVLIIRVSATHYAQEGELAIRNAIERSLPVGIMYLLEVV